MALEAIRSTPQEEVLYRDGPENFAKTRRLELAIEVTGSGDDALRPYIERALKIWMARGCPEDGLVEELSERAFDNRPAVTITLSTKHRVI